MSLPTNINKILNPEIVESVRVELKEGWNPLTILHTICAFANDIDNFYGGYIIIGIKDNNEVIGFDRSKFDELQKEVFRYCKKCLEPSYVPVIDIVKYLDKDVAVLWCPAGEQKPYKCYENVYKSKNETQFQTYIRKGSLTVLASHEEEKELYNIGNFIPFDDRVNYKYDLSVIDKDIVREYLKKADSNLLFTFNSQSLEQILFDLRVLSGPSEHLCPKNIALLMFTNNPSLYIPYSYIDVTILKDLSGDELIEKTFDSALFKQYEDCMEYLKNKVIEKKIIKVEGDYKSITVFNYSYEVLEEVVANAILHKSYQINEPVSIRVEPDKIEVTSVPGFDRTISNTAIKELKPKSKRYQSRRIAEFLKELGIVEAKNTGYPRIIKKSLENHYPLPIIEMNEERDYVTVVIPINKNFVNNNFSLEDRIIDLLQEKPLTKTELALALGYPRVVNSLSYRLNKLIKEQKVAIIEKKYSLI